MGLGILYLRRVSIGFCAEYQRRDKNAQHNVSSVVRNYLVLNLIDSTQALNRTTKSLTTLINDINFVIISMVRLADNIILSRPLSSQATITRGTELYKHIMEIINTDYLNPEVAKARYSCPFLSRIDVFQQSLVWFQLQFDQELWTIGSSGIDMFRKLTVINNMHANIWLSWKTWTFLFIHTLIWKNCY